jgi:circadian clock protein KaiC
VSTEIISTGIPDLDAMLKKGGWYRGSTTMISGESGTGKTTCAAIFVDAACDAGERCLYLAFEESQAQIVRNMGSVGVKLNRWLKDGVLRISSSRPTQVGLESHLTELYRQVEEHKPTVVVIDPITDFTTLGSSIEIKSMLMRIVDYLKTNQITAVFTSLMPEASTSDDPTISSLIDNWVQLRNLELDAERNRGLYIQKARGMAHSNQIREFEIHNRGIRLLEVVSDPGGGVVTGRARASKTTTTKKAR